MPLVQGWAFLWRYQAVPRSRFPTFSDNRWADLGRAGLKTSISCTGVTQEASLEGNPPLSALSSLKWMMELQELLASLDSTPMYAHLHGFSLQLPCYLA